MLWEATEVVIQSSRSTNHQAQWSKIQKKKKKGIIINLHGTGDQETWCLFHRSLAFGETKIVSVTFTADLWIFNEVKMEQSRQASRRFLPRLTLFHYLLVFIFPTEKHQQPGHVDTGTHSSLNQYIKQCLFSHISVGLSVCKTSPSPSLSRG